MDWLLIMSKVRFIKIFIKFTMFALGILHSKHSIANELQREFRSARHLGEGDAGISHAVGSDAIFYNPAGIADNKGVLSEVVLLSPQLTLSPEISTLVKDAQGDTDALTLLSKNQNKTFYADVQNFSGIVFKKTALGALAKANVSAYVFNDPVSGMPTVQAYASSRIGAYMAFAKDLFQQAFLLGANIKFINKTEADISMTALEAEQDLANNNLSKVIKDKIHRGNGIGADFGFIFSPKNKKNFKLGVVYRNVGMVYRWPIPEGSTPPSREPQVLDVGTSILSGTKYSMVKLAFDLRDVTNVQKVSVYNRMHLGAEINFLEI
ncbi:MAG: hypothetical protein K2X39_02395, partial [Silvanigrellaceae bacterium]|nr:hypothetical protein [Silvanigrellaceae bacterium]